MTITAKKGTASPGAPGVPYYTPAQNPPVGTATPKEGEQVPTLFTPLKLRSLELQNRFAVSPMCMYSADNGHMTDFHLVHLGAYAMRGAALTIVEATAVAANGRISPEDVGLWQDSQIAGLKRVVDFVHSQGQKVGVQLAHAGRKASTLGMWHIQRGKGEVAGIEVGGWPEDVWGPSALPFSAGYPHPKELSIAQIEGVVEAFAAAAKRALAAGVDTLEIHAAHGYLLTEFLSPLSNKRTDKYGGSFENRTRLLLDTIKAVRAVMPETMPLLVRISATEWMEWAGEPSWTLEESIELAKLLPALGVDLLDVSSGGNTHAQKIVVHPYFQVDLAQKIREALEADGKALKIGAVGLITNAEMAKSIVQADGTLAGGGGGQANGTVEVETEVGKARADMVLMARQFLREPEFVLRTAHELGVTVRWPNQYGRGSWPKTERL